MFDFFKKKKDPVEESGKLEMNKEMFLSTMKVITDYTQRDVIKIELSNDECSIFDSKFGGLPYLGVDDEVPLSTDNKQLRLLGQINFADLPMNSYQLEARLLQFWAMDNDLYGLDFENMISQAESRVIYYSRDVTSTQPGYSIMPSSRERSVSTSRSLVGSSSRMTLAPFLSILAKCTRLRSPPESCPTFFCWSPP